MKCLALCLLLSVAAFGVSAGEEHGFALGFGTRPCRDWTAYRASGGERAALAQQWVLGYFSGWNDFDPRPKEPFFGYDVEHITGFIDRMCAAEPKRRLGDVAGEWLMRYAKNFDHLKPPRHR